MTDRRQRQKEQRAQKREQEKKRDRRRELRRRLTTGIILAVIAIGVLILTTTDFSSGDLPSGYQGFRNQPTACGAEQPPPLTPMSFETPVAQTDITPSSRVTATVVTSCGTMVIELDPEGFPATANSFVFLAREGFFDGQVWFRVSENFRAHSGDPNADGTGGPGYIIPDERPPSDFDYVEGVVAMDNRGSRSTGSQFFVVIGDDGRVLTPSFNVLGRVISGEDTLTRIEEVPRRVPPGSNERSLPTETIYIESVTIEVSGG